MGVFEGDFNFKPVTRKIDVRLLPWWKRWTSWIFDWDSNTEYEIETELRYTDDSGHLWTIRPGDRFDGASIPRVLWPIIGSPMRGDYVVASAFHDIYLGRKTRDSKDVHKLFCEMLHYSGVPLAKRNAMCLGVKVGGPKFEV